MDEYVDCPHCGHESDHAEFAAEGGHCPVCSKYNEELDMGRHFSGSLRVAAIDFLASQNVTDREELLFRAHRHASNKTAQLPVPVAQRTVQAFVAAVNQEIRPEAPRRVAPVQRTAAVSDFADELLFDS